MNAIAITGTSETYGTILHLMNNGPVAFQGWWGGLWAAAEFIVSLIKMQLFGKSHVL